MKKRLDPPRFAIAAIELYERPVVLRIPFRFGLATVTQAPQAFVRVRIRTGGGPGFEGAAAELMIPKWFDKSADRSNEDNVDDLRRALAAAADAYTAEARPLTAFAHSAAHYEALLAAGSRNGLNPLTASYGGALIDRALLDALCRWQDVSFYAALAGNVLGIDASLTADLAAFDFDAFFERCAPARSIAARHTVGLADPIARGDAGSGIDDGLPEALEDVIATYGNRYFKLKLCGDAKSDVDRLLRVAAILDRLPHYGITLDGNEQFSDAAAVLAFWREAQASLGLSRLLDATLYLEQPLPRALAMSEDLRALAAIKPLLIDESDATVDAFPAAAALGYTGVSSKGCKGLYKSLLNAARRAQWNAACGGTRFFLSGEDLTTQAGLSLQQDLALVNAIGLEHVERNGHHYVDGFAGQGASEAERHAFLRAHPGLYHASAGNVRLTLHAGTIDLSSLDAPGFASGAFPDWNTVTPLKTPVMSSFEPIPLG